jgi:C-terminal peptidase prc
LAYFHEIWQIVDENYVYQDFNGVDWAAVEHGYDDQIRAAQTTTEFYAIVQTAIDLLADDHTRFDTPQQTFEEDAAYTGSAGYAGIGVMLRDLSDSVLVIRIGRNGPADQAGVQIYDRITAVDGRAISDFYAAEDDYGAAVRGEIGTTVTLTIQRGSATLTIPIVRNAIPGDAFPEATAMLIPDTRVQLLTIDSFNREQLGELIVEALAAARPSDGPVSGLIIDVRENGGGEVQAMLDTIGLFADGGSIGSTVGRGSSEELLVDAGNTLDGYGDIPIAVLIGPGTVSAAEMFASGMHSLRGATLVGTTSAGNTENLYPYDFDDGAVLWLAEVLFRQRNGTYVDNVGVTPDIEVPDDTDITDLAHDPALQAALASFP